MGQCWNQILRDSEPLGWRLVACMRRSGIGLRGLRLSALKRTTGTPIFHVKACRRNKKNKI